MAEKQRDSIESLLAELKTVKTDITIGEFTFRELSYEQQRKLTSTSSGIVEIIAATRNLLNEYIGKNVEYANDVANITNNVTLDIRPFLLNVLRTISIGKDIIENKKTYELYTVNPEDLVSTFEPEIYKRDNFELVINVPTLRVDNIYNALLIGALSQYKNTQARTMTETEAGTINELYNFYETMKYIESFTIKKTKYDFIELPTQDKIRVLNQFPQQIISVVNRYRKRVDTLVTKAFTATNPNDGSTIEIDQELQLFIIPDETL